VTRATALTGELEATRGLSRARWRRSDTGASALPRGAQARLGLLRRLGSVAAATLLAAGIAGADDRVYPSPEAVEPLSAGARVPPAQVETLAGDPVDLAEVVRDHGALLVFYRGGW